MEIIVHGTKGGYKVLYQTPNTPFSIARDARRIDRNDGNTVGQSAYSIAFAEKGCAFSKYVIVRDTERAAVGNVAFTAYIPATKKLSGSEIKTLLDDLAGRYCQDYVVVGNLGNKQEDWTFVTALANQFDSRLQNVSADDAENMQSGTQDAAFVYYSGSAELEKYLAAPYQQEYSNYRQIFFVEQRFENLPENPLNALRNSDKDFTRQINLENPKYKLKDFCQSGKNGVTIELWANDYKRSDKDVISCKDTIRIRYSKNDRYFIPIDETGKITDSKIAQYLSIVDENKITVKNDVILQLVVQRISLEVKNRNGNIISDAEITCKNEFSMATKPVASNEIRFEGEELKDRWTVLAQKGDLSAQHTLIPESNISSILLVLLEHQKDKITSNRGRENTDPELNNNTLLAPFRKKESFYSKHCSKIWAAGSVVIVGLIAVFIFHWQNINRDKDNNTSLNISKIETVLQKYKNNLDSLQHYKAIWDKLKPEIEIEKKGGWLGIGGKSVKATNYKQWEETDLEIMEAIKIAETTKKKIIAYLEGIELKEFVLEQYKDSIEDNSLRQHIDKCIALRKSLNLGEVSKIKKSDYRYSTDQKPLEEAMNLINDRNKNFVGNAMNKTPISKKNVIEISEFIKQKVKEDNNKNNSSTVSGNSTKGNNDVTPPVTSFASATNILQTEFWNLVNSGNVKKASYDALLKTYKKQNDDIVTYLNKICKNSKSFNKFKNIPEKDRKSANTLTQIDIE